MSGESNTKFCCDYDKRGMAGCKKCKTKCEKGALRIAKVVPNFFHDGEGEMKQWYHPKCLFETFEKARATTKVIESSDEIEGFSVLTDEDKAMVKSLINDLLTKRSSKGSTPKKAAAPKSKPPASKAAAAADVSSVKVEVKEPIKSSPVKSIKAEPTIKVESDSPLKLTKVRVEENVPEDSRFENWIRLCSLIAERSSYNDKTSIVANWLKKGSRGTTFNGNTYLTIKLLLPGFVKRVYNINSKQLVKLFSQAFGTSLPDMTEHLDKGDVAETIKVFFEKSPIIKPQSASTLSLKEVDEYLEQMSKVTKEDDQQAVLTAVAKRSTAEDLRMVVRLIKHDLRINAGAKHVLEGLDSNAYEAFQASRNLQDVVERVLAHKAGDAGKLQVRAQLMTPVLPMLAEACRSIEQAMKKCPEGMYAEIKYDGERVQLHKSGTEFQYFSRSLKPVLPHKVSHFKEFIPAAFPCGDNLILDAEVLLVDTNTSKPLPFGTLGVHKKAAFKDAQVCLFVFDCLYYNDENLMNKPIRERREFLHKVMKEIPNRVMFSEQHEIKAPSQLNSLLEKVFRENLEGLVLKGYHTIYEPGKRHWLKVKKDYLSDGAMADSADLVVLGAYYGTGNKGGIMSVFLMGCYDPASKMWCTVTKVHGGHDDETLERLQKELKMTKISKDSSKLPSWLLLNTKGTLTPDFVITDPKDSQVWEITGAEFSKSDIHTADGISIRFPRVTKIRDDKDWTTATDLPRLKKLFEESKDKSDFSLTKKNFKPSSSSADEDDETENDSPKKKQEKSKPPPDVSSESKPKKRSPADAPAKAKGGKQSPSSASPVKKSKLDKEAALKNKSWEPAAQLPDVFMNKIIFIPNDHSESAKLRRYAIAYGAVLANDEEEADFVVASDLTKKSEKSVTAHWLNLCINAGKIVDRC